jgi:hypothetical protein
VFADEGDQQREQIGGDCDRRLGSTIARIGRELFKPFQRAVGPDLDGLQSRDFPLECPRPVHPFYNSLVFL